MGRCWCSGVARRSASTCADPTPIPAAGQQEIPKLLAQGLKFAAAAVEGSPVAEALIAEAEILKHEVDGLDPQIHGWIPQACRAEALVMFQASSEATTGPRSGSGRRPRAANSRSSRV